MYKKAMVLEEMVKLVIVFAILVIFAWLIFRVLSPPESKTADSFKTLGAEINLLVKDLKAGEKREINVPLFMEASYVIESINAGTQGAPKGCENNPCLLLRNRDNLKVVNKLKFDNLEFSIEDKYIKTTQSGIIKVNVAAEKTDAGTKVYLKQVS